MATKADIKKTAADWTDEEAQNRFVWLTSAAGQELLINTGGVTHQPVFSAAGLETLGRIADTAAALVERYSGEPEAKIEDPAETPKSELPEQAQKDLRAEERAAKKG